MFKTSLRDLPRAARCLLTFTLVSFVLNHIFSAWLVWEVGHNVAESAQEHFHYKSFATLLRMAHQHTFGHGTMYALTGAIFLFAGASERATILLISGVFLGAWADLGSWFGLKYGGASWEYVSMFSGTLFAICFFAMAAISLYRMWVPTAATRR